MKKVLVAISLGLFVLLSGCGSKEGVKSEETSSYLYFTGNAKGAEVTLDNASHFIIEASGPEEHYKVTPGKHNIVVKQNGQVLVNRTLLLGDGIAREIRVP